MKVPKIHNRQAMISQRNQHILLTINKPKTNNVDLTCAFKTSIRLYISSYRLNFTRTRLS